MSQVVEGMWNHRSWYEQFRGGWVSIIIDIQVHVCWIFEIHNDVLKKQKLLSATPQATLRLLSFLQCSLFNLSNSEWKKILLLIIIVMIIIWIIIMTLLSYFRISNSLHWKVMRPRIQVCFRYFILLNNYISWEVIKILYFGTVSWGLFLESPGNFSVFASRSKFILKMIRRNYQ